jgi:hypothetical protein
MFPYIWQVEEGLRLSAGHSWLTQTRRSVHTHIIDPVDRKKSLWNVGFLLHGDDGYWTREL